MARIFKHIDGVPFLFKSSQYGRAIAVAVALLAAFWPRAGAAAPDFWIAGPGEWSLGTNWTFGVPGSADDAINITGAAIDFNTNDSVNSFITNGSFGLTGGTLGGSQASAASTFEVDNTFTFNGGGIYNATLVQGVGGTVLVAGNGSNSINACILNANISVGGGYVQLYNFNSASADINLAGGNIQLHDGNTTLSLLSSAELDGQGTLNEAYGNSTLSNAGLVSADVTGQTLYLNNTYITGAGTYQAVNGGTLSIGATLNGTNTIVHANTGTVLINGGGVTGTVSQATGTGLTFTGNGNNYMSNATVDGTLTFPSGSYAQLYNTNTVSGEIDMAANGSGIQLHDGNASLTLALGTLLRGYGSVYEVYGGSTLQNLGTVSADTSGQVLYLNCSNITGSGTLDARNGGIISIGGQLNGSGMRVNVDANPGSVVEINGGSVTGTIGPTTGTGLSFTGNGNNYISSATINGTLTFPSGSYAQVYNANTVSGEIDMAANGSGIQLHDGNASLTLSLGTLLRGYGSVYEVYGGSTLQNLGTISADTSGEVLYLNTTNLTGSGTLDARNGGIISIGGQLNGSGMQVNVDANPNSAVEINGGGLTGTIGPTTGTGLSFTGNGNNFISSATVNGTLTFPNGSYAQVYNANTVSGEIDMAANGSGIQLHDGNASLTVSLGALLRGYGSIYQVYGGTTLQNLGTVSADVSTQVLYLNTTNLTGSGTLDARNGGIVSIGALLNASGMQVHVDANPGSAVEINGGGLTGTLGSTTGTGLSFTGNGNNFISAATVNGTLTFPNGGYAQAYNTNIINGPIVMATSSNGIQLHDGNASLQINPGGSLSGFGNVYQVYGGATVNNAGTIAANAIGQTLAFYTDNFTSSGNITVVPSSTLLVQTSLIQTAGLTTVDGTLVDNNPMLLRGGILDGTGVVDATVINTGGIVSPGDAPGLLDIIGSYSQGPLGELDIQLGGHTAGSGFSQLDISSSASLDGTLNVDLYGGFLPHVGDTFDILLSQNDTGIFASDLSSYPGLAYTVSYYPTYVQIQITAVPEPAGMMVIAVGAAALLARRRD